MEITEIAELLIISQRKLQKYAQHLTRDSDRADDLLQETFIRILSNANKFENEGKFICWALKIMHNTFINNARHEERCQTVEELLYSTPLKNRSYCDSNAEINEIYNAIDNLPGNASKVMRLFISGHKYIEISVIMNIPLGTVKTRINHSRAILKKKLKDYLN